MAVDLNMQTYLTTTVFALGTLDDQRVSIQQWIMQDGTAVIPFFSSLEQLQPYLPESQQYLSLPARDLFVLSAGAPLVRDPESSNERRFDAHEVLACLAPPAAPLAATSSSASTPTPTTASSMIGRFGAKLKRGIDKAKA